MKRLINSSVLEEPVIFTLKMKSHKYSKINSLGLEHTPNISHKKQEPTHNEEKIALVLALASDFAIWNMLR